MLKVMRRIALVLLGLVFCALALAGALSVTRGTPVRAVLAPGQGGLPSPGDSLFARSVELYAGTALAPGNHIDILLNGDETYPLLWNDLRSARQTITVQLYFALPGGVADTMAAVLAERSRAGVRVLLVLDAFGAGPLGDGYMQRLLDAGVEGVWLRPVRWYTLHKASQRSHVRAIVIDGSIGYTGGFGLADYWLGDGVSEGEWRETNVRFEGPAVTQLQAAFAAGWAEGTGELLTGTQFFPVATFDETGGVSAALMHTVPTIGSTAAERYLALTIAGASRTLYIANSYFVPSDDFVGLLSRARRRGVDVRVLTTGPETDILTIYYAGRQTYEALLRAGVRIYEYTPTNMHAKTIVVDGLWSSVGSMNFDNRSLAFNDESTLLVLDAGVGTRMDAIFLADLEHAREITLPVFTQRGWTHRVMEWGAGLVSRLL